MKEGKNALPSARKSVGLDYFLKKVAGGEEKEKKTQRAVHDSLIVRISLL